MTLTVGTDTYCTLLEANAYFANTLSSSVWLAISEPNREIVLKMACRKMENEIYLGDKLDSEQALQFPRNYGTPQDIKDAQSELALYLYQNQSNQVLNAKQMGLGSISLGNESYTFTSGGSITNIMSVEAQSLMDKWLKKVFKVV